ncbi:MAG: hypothetical protein IJZ76_02090 [Lachnospiraceae bacterium]|nr:hypothetical protein [Lachnospiraceae bacterium]
MLKKLFVHEWKDSWRLVGIMNLIVIGLTLIGTFFLNNETWNAMDKNEFIAVTVVVYMMFFIASIAALSMVVTFYFYIRFYRNLYTDQGYLMHTLPVTAHQLIWSKTFVATIWMVISTVVMVGSIFGLVFAAIPGEERGEFWREMSEAFAMMDFDGRAVVIVVLYILAIIVGQLSNVFMGYASISIGQMFKKQKVLGAIGVYIGIYMLIQTVSSYGMMFVTMFIDPYVMETSMEADNFMIVFLLILMLISGLLTTGFYFITHYIMKNKLNLE